MTCKEFFNAAAAFDWYYEMSDDHRVWRAGNSRLRELQAEAQGDSVKLAILDAWKEHMFSGKPWNTERTARPLISDFVEEA